MNKYEGNQFFLMNKQNGKITTSIKIDPKVWEETRIQAIRDKITFSEALENALKEWLKKK